MLGQDLEAILSGLGVYFNLSASKLVELSLERKEGVLTSCGALRTTTGKYTGRSPKDKFIVDEPSVREKIAWGPVNPPISEEKFLGLYRRVIDYIFNRELFVFDGFAGADPDYRLPIRVINEFAWHNLFVHELFILSGYTSKLAGTERGVAQPEATFSTCFGAPFLPLSPSVYARMLGEKISQHNVNVYLVNF